MECVRFDGPVGRRVVIHAFGDLSVPRLLVEKGPDRGKSVTVTVGGQIVAGRDKEASLQLSDSMASRRHFLIASKGSIFGLKDLNSANGTLVNGRQAAGAHKLQYGDSIQVGETLISWLADETGDKHGGLIGQQIGGYRIEERLGRGAMGTVYKATQLSLGRTVALKVLAQDLVKDEKFCEMFVKEARAAGSLNHPNIIQVYDVGDEDSNYFFSMEYASKGSVLEELTGVKAIAMPRAVKVIKDACSALDYAERKGLVHRDIKPDNLMVTEDDTVKLGDLGLAMSTQELQAEQDGVFGTPHYIAPEQAMGKPIDHRADIYALGATFYRMLTGKTLFTGATVKEILKKQVREQHKPITDHLPDCPAAIAKIIDRMLAKNPAERYQHASEVMQDLSDWENLATRKAATSGAAFAERPGKLSPDASQEMYQVKQRQKLIIAGVVAAVAVLAAAASIYFFVFAGSGPAANNNTTVATNNSGTTPANNGGAPELPKEVRTANQNIRDELNIANFQVAENPKSEDYDSAIARIENALAENPKGSSQVRSDAQARIDELIELRDQLTATAADVQDEFDEAVRDSLKLMDEFKYAESGKVIDDFITKYDDTTNEEIREIVERAKSYFNSTHGVEVQARIENFKNDVNRDMKDALVLSPLARVTEVEAILKRTQDAETACDDDYYRKTYTKLAEEIEKKLRIFREQASTAEKQELAEAFSRASKSLQNVLLGCRQDVAKGNFKNVGKRLDDWVASNADYKAHKDKDPFKPIAEDIVRRRQQTEQEHRALLKLQSSGVLPSIIETNKLLKTHPWPAEVEEFLGGEQAFFTLDVESRLDDEQWSITIFIDGKPTTRKSSEITSSDDRKALAAAITHLLQHHDGAMDKLMKPVTPGGPPALVGLFAWMAELEAYEAAFPVIEYAWTNVGANDPARGVVREYYAWGLLGLANALNAQGDAAGARARMAELSGKFSDTRAYKGRK